VTRTKLGVIVTDTACIASGLTMCAFARTALTIAKPAVRHVATWLNINTVGLGLSRSQICDSLLPRAEADSSDQNLFLVLSKNNAQPRSDFADGAVAFYCMDYLWHQIGAIPRRVLDQHESLSTRFRISARAQGT
jgi:hypothetical protein